MSDLNKGLFQSSIVDVLNNFTFGMKKGFKKSVISISDLEIGNNNYKMDSVVACDSDDYLNLLVNKPACKLFAQTILRDEILVNFVFYNSDEDYLNKNEVAYYWAIDLAANEYIIGKNGWEQSNGTVSKKLAASKVFSYSRTKANQWPGYGNVGLSCSNQENFFSNYIKFLSEVYGESFKIQRHYPHDPTHIQGISINGLIICHTSTKNSWGYDSDFSKAFKQLVKALYSKISDATIKHIIDINGKATWQASIKVVEHNGNIYILEYDKNYNNVINPEGRAGYRLLNEESILLKNIYDVSQDKTYSVIGNEIYETPLGATIKNILKTASLRGITISYNNQPITENTFDSIEALKYEKSSISGLHNSQQLGAIFIGMLINKDNTTELFKKSALEVIMTNILTNPMRIYNNYKSELRHYFGNLNDDANNIYNLTGLNAYQIDKIKDVKLPIVSSFVFLLKSLLKPEEYKSFYKNVSYHSLFRARPVKNEKYVSIQDISNDKFDAVLEKMVSLFNETMFYLDFSASTPSFVNQYDMIYKLISVIVLQSNAENRQEKIINRLDNLLYIYKNQKGFTFKPHYERFNVYLSTLNQVISNKDVIYDAIKNAHNRGDELAEEFGEEFDIDRYLKDVIKPEDFEAYLQSMDSNLSSPELLEDRISILNLISRVDFYQGETHNFQKLYYKVWNKLEVESENYVVVAPKAPIDVIQEGVSLSHCVARYVPSIAKAESTVLFIRDKKNPHQSLYTVEYKGSKLTQIQGFANSSAIAPEAQRLADEVSRKIIEINKKQG